MNACLLHTNSFISHLCTTGAVIPHNTTLSFAACVPMVCSNLIVLDDCVLEEEESFNMFLAVTSDLRTNIKIDKEQAVVTIIDNDSMYILRIS